MAKRKRSSEKGDQQKQKASPKTKSRPVTPPIEPVSEHLEEAQQNLGETEPPPPGAAHAVVGMGASAGGLDAFKQFFAATPPDSGMAFVLIQHLHPLHGSLTSELLGKHTQMPVVDVEDDMPVEANHVYVIPPNTYLAISGRKLHLSEPVERRGVRVPIDFFFRSLADDQRERAIGIILTGAGSDGTLGAREIKAAGGMVMVQEPATTQFDSMPRSAIGTGMVDLILPIEKMPSALLRYVQHWYLNGNMPPAPKTTGKSDHIGIIVGLLRARIKYDFSCYKKGTLTRRIQRRMGLNHIEKLTDYIELLRQKKDEVTALYKDLLISVTNFFREPEAWDILERQVVAPLVSEHDNDMPIRIWVPGCATGEEPYSIAMLFTEQLQLADKSCQLQIFASDIDQDALSFARAGVYPENIATDVTPERLRHFFTRGEHTYRISKEIRDAVVFAEQNLVTHPPFSKLDLISCRNVLIYLEADIQKRILSLFHFALREGGYLFLGGSESVSQHSDLFEAVSRKHRIYKRVGPTRHDRLDFPLTRREAPPPITHLPGDALGGGTSRRMTSLGQQLVLQRFVPACAVINRKAEVLYLHGNVDEYLQLPAGELGPDLLAMARDGLRTKLRSAVHQAIRDNRTVRLGDVRVHSPRKYRRIRLTVEPLTQPKEAIGLLLVTFHEIGKSAEHNDPPPPLRSKDETREPDPTADYESIVHQLEEELRSTREDLQSTIEELETSNEEFKASNEEATSINEELQSTNEELETSKEELQSLNEELQTVNNQLEQKVNELESTNNDLHNLLSSSDIATIFLDRGLRLKRFTPAILPLIRLLESDIGRPITDFAPIFMDPDLLNDAELVLRNLMPMEKEVQDRQGRFYARRTVPYRTEDSRIDGVVVTFSDITRLKKQEQELRQLTDELEQRVQARAQQAHRLIEEAPDAIIVINQQGQMTQVNRRTEAMFGYVRDELIGRAVEMLLPEGLRVRHREYRDRFFAEPKARPMGPGMSLVGLHNDGREISIEVQLNSLTLNNEPVAIASIRNVAERRRLHETLTHMAALINTSYVAFLLVNPDGTISRYNRGAEQLFGYAAEEVLGRNVRLLLPPGASDDFSSVVAHLQAGETMEEYETVRQHKDGTQIDVAVTASRVEDANGEMTDIWKIYRDIGDRKSIEKRIASAANDERRRFAQELHDSLGQNITAIGLLAASLQTPSEPTDVDTLKTLNSTIDRTKQEVRALLKGFLPVQVAADGLRNALEQLAADTSQVPGIRCRFDCDEDLEVADNFVATQLFFIAREAVHNAVKYAHGEISVSLNDSGDHDSLQLSVQDNGPGLDTSLVPADSMGLRIMKYRAGLIGGVLSITSSPGQGTLVSCVVQRRTSDELGADSA